MNEELRELLAEKTLKILEAIEDFEQERITFMVYLETVKQLAQELQTILDKTEFMNKH